VWRSAGAILSVAAPAGGWHHVVYTYDGTTQRLYLDGTQADTSTAAPDTGAVATARIATQQAGSERFTGDVDEVRIYNRALSAADVTALHAGME
jgi:hypothetical protein